MPHYSHRFRRNSGASAQPPPSFQFRPPYRPASAQVSPQRGPSRPPTARITQPSRPAQTPRLTPDPPRGHLPARPLQPEEKKIRDFLYDVIDPFRLFHRPRDHRR
jgi:hypothetical protein